MANVKYLGSLRVQIVLLIIIVHSKIFHVHEINIWSNKSKNISELKMYVSSGTFFGWSTWSPFCVSVLHLQVFLMHYKFIDVVILGTSIVCATFFVSGTYIVLYFLWAIKQNSFRNLNEFMVSQVRFWMYNCLFSTEIFKYSVWYFVDTDNW